MPLASVAPNPATQSSDMVTGQPTGHLAFPALTGSNSLLQRTLFPVTLKFEEIVYKVGSTSDSISKEKTILNGITGMVSPGEILAMLGPSGSGKTTLLTALGGRLTGKLSGMITYNGHPFSSSIRRKTGFVSQDDVLYQHLTVFETLLFTALLRLPNSLKKQDKIHHVESVITELGLTKCQNSMIGGPLFRGISGGEKKRVSIGQEMLINPSLLLLDEPTSGLDSTTAQRIINTIRGLASCGRTVVTTIHQPSSRVYHLFDKVVVLSEGHPIYYGSGSNALEYFSSIGFSSSISINPADLLLDLANGIAPDFCDQIENKNQDPKLVREFLLSAYEKNISGQVKTEVWSSEISNYNRSARSDVTGEKWSTSWWYQFKILMLRGLRERRFEAFSKLRIFQVVSVAILGGLLWWQTPPSHIDDRLAMLFFYSVFWGFYPLYNAVFTFPQERTILIKERSSSMYRLSSYFLARIVSDLPLDLALPTAFTFIFYFMGGLKHDPIAFVLSLLIVLVSVLVSQGLGLVFGAILMDVKQAATLASVTTLVFMIAGGYYVRKIPLFIGWMKYLSFSFYCYKMLLGVQYGEDDVYECGSGVYCKVLDFPAVKSVGLRGSWVDAAVMAMMLVGYRVVAYFALRRAL